MNEQLNKMMAGVTILVDCPSALLVDGECQHRQINPVWLDGDNQVHLVSSYSRVPALPVHWYGVTNNHVMQMLVDQLASVGLAPIIEALQASPTVHPAMIAWTAAQLWASLIGVRVTCISASTGEAFDLRIDLNQP